MKVYNHKDQHYKVLVKVLKYCRNIHEVLFRSLQPVHSRETVENTHWSQELLYKRRFLEYTDMKVLSLAALVKFSGTKKTWEIIFLKPILC